MESLHQDTFKRQAPARTPSDYAHLGMGSRSPINNATDALASTPRSELANMSPFDSSSLSSPSSLESLSERLDHIGNGMAYNAMSSKTYNAIDEALGVHEASSSRMYQHEQADVSMQNFTMAEDGERFPGVQTPGIEAGIWDADPLNVVGSGTGAKGSEKNNRSPSSTQASKEKNSEALGKARGSKAAQKKMSPTHSRSSDPDIFKHLLDRMRYWPEQDRAFSRTVGLFGFLVFMKTPYSRNMTRLGLMGVMACAWPLETAVLLRKVSTKLGWELKGLRDWWRRELAKNNSDDSDGDDFVKVASIPNVQVLEDGMEVEVVDSETFGTSENGVSIMSPGMKRGESRAINKQANASRAKKEKKQANDDEWQGISISEMKEAIKNKVDKAAEKLGEVVQETAGHVEDDLASTRRQLQHVSARSISAHEKAKAEFEAQAQRPSDKNASGLFGILSEEEAASGKCKNGAVEPSPAFTAPDMAVEDAPAELFGILGSDSKAPDETAPSLPVGQGKKAKKMAKKNKGKN
ncbi:hypothetical protein CFO_g2733 [Ceratocystis platani]|uniref:Uncharacterized protein n=1 Tax=Ceratocystis fimbriata f. sp. platani TaxID=88771 RepID=A0A0F8B416_CERFI|nr:hypothetical protein CFO_g2733 [Ceratocystis platani]